MSDAVVVVEATEPEPSSDDTVIVVDNGDSNDATDAVQVAVEIDHEGRIVRLEDVVTVLAGRMDAIETNSQTAEVMAEAAMDIAIDASETANAVEEEESTDTPPPSDEPPTSKRHRWWK